MNRNPVALVGAAALVLALPGFDPGAHAGTTNPVTIHAVPTTPAWTTESNVINGDLGASISTAGDVNGDGYADVIVGAETYGGNGAAFAYYGSPSGLPATPSWSVASDTTDSFLGHVAAPAGDVNGDGYADVIVTAYLSSGALTFQGRAFVYHGSASGLATTPARVLQVGSANAFFGSSAGTAGDVNGDGYDDVIVGAFGYNGHGGAFVYYGSPTGVPANPSWFTESIQSGAGLGAAVSTAGDVNGDGFADVIIGADGWTNGQTQEGKAQVHLGSSTGLVAAAAWTVESNQAIAHFGCAVATAGDTNGDGYADVIVGAEGFTAGQTSEGRAFVFRGGASGLALTASWTAESDQANAFFGHAVAPAGDVNQDGFADVIVGANRFDDGQTDEGRAYVYYGSPVGPTTPRWFASSDVASSDFGGSVGTAGDVDGDGYPEILVGAKWYTNGEAQEGAAYLYRGSGDGSSLFPEWGQESNQALANYGSVVGSAGDVNGDGYSDLLIAAQGYDNVQFDEGRAFVHYGSSAGPSFIENFTTESNQNSAFMGFATSVASAGDVNADGFSDLIVGMPFYDDGQTDEGRIHIHAGGPSGLQVPIFYFAQTNETDAHFGISVASAGDVNGDGYGDVIVGAEQASAGQSREGRAYVLHGGPGGITFAWSGESDQANAHYGNAVAGAGDVNGDGYSDVIVGAQHYDDGVSDVGRVYVYLGSPGGLSSAPAWTITGTQANAELGSAVASAGDVNGDGYSDVIVGADLYDGAFGNEGKAEIYLGSASGLSPTPVWAVTSRKVIAGVGMSVASAGDVNGDGYSDVVVGYRQYTNTVTAEGGAFAYHGGPAGPDTTADWSAFGGQASAQFGNAVGCAGDVNGDGFSDVVVGAWLLDNGASNEGYVFAYYGNFGDGLDRAPRQLRASGTAPIALLGQSNAEDAFQARALGRTATGRGKVRLVVETKPLGTPFDGTGLVTGAPTLTSAPNNAGSSATLTQLVGGLFPNTPHHWRARIATASPYFAASRWVSPAGNGPAETDFRTADPTPRVLTIDPGSVVEGNAGTTQLVLNVIVDPEPYVPITVDWATEDGTATAASGDYDAASGTVTLQPQQGSAQIAITVHGDLEHEFDETLSVFLSNPQGAEVIVVEATGTIVDDGDPSGLEACPETWVADGAVEAIAEKDGTVYLGGSFKEVGPKTGCALPFDTGSGAALGVPQVEGTVYAVASDGAGGWFIGGDFLRVGGLPRAHIAHLGADHTPSSWNPGASSTVRALAVSGGLVYSGGDFVSVGGQSRLRLAALDATTGAVTPWNPSANAPVRALAVANGVVYAGGAFTVLGANDGRPHLAAIDPVTGVATSWNPGATGNVNAILPLGGLVYVGGEFDVVAGSTRLGLAAVDPVDESATAWDPQPNGFVNALAAGSGVIYVGGSFGSIHAQSRTGIAAVDVATGLPTAWNPNAGATVFALAVSGGTVYAGGQFAAIGGSPIRHLAALDASTGTATAWNPRANGYVRALALASPSGPLYAGGEFTSAGGQTRLGLAAVDGASGALTPWNPGTTGGAVLDLEVSGNVVYAAGGFTSVAGFPRQFLAAIDRTTGLPTAWAPSANFTVQDLALGAGVVYAGGSFTSIGGATRQRIAALDATTGTATSWDPVANNAVNALVVSGGTVYAGGAFTLVKGLVRHRIAAISAATGVPTSWDPDASDVVRALEAANGVVYAGGQFLTIGGAARENLAALDPATGSATSWHPAPDGIVRALSVGPGAVYAGGDFANVGAAPVNFLAAIDPVSGRALLWTPQPTGTVHAIARDATSIYLGGFFPTIAGTAHSYFACIRTAESTVDVPDAGASPSELALRLSPNPSFGPARIELDLPHGGPVRVSVYDVRGRLVARPLDEQRPAGHHALAWNGAGTSGRLAAGIYWMRLDAGGTSVTQRLVRMN
jgi:hypothetical protein